MITILLNYYCYYHVSSIIYNYSFYSFIIIIIILIQLLLF